MRPLKVACLPWMVSFNRIVFVSGVRSIMTSVSPLSMVQLPVDLRTRLSCRLRYSE
ncbi:MAG TPA: hypothetical protein VNU70_01360 [Puia sp.]|nr:hypothetical protein [Puia sp.]